VIKTRPRKIDVCLDEDSFVICFAKSNVATNLYRIPCHRISGVAIISLRTRAFVKLDLKTRDRNRVSRPPITSVAFLSTSQVTRRIKEFLRILFENRVTDASRGRGRASVNIFPYTLSYSRQGDSFQDQRLLRETRRGWPWSAKCETH